MLVKKTTPLPVSCVVHGYLTGAGWQEYQEVGTMFGFSLPAGMVKSQRLPVPLFVPLIQGEAPETGFSALEECCGRILAENLRTATLRLFFKAWKLARARGVLLVESTFEFGLCEGGLHLIDECITLETSQFWDVKAYKVGDSLPKTILNDTQGNQELHGAQQQSIRNYPDLYLKLTGQKL